jgi:hypothetical protein
MAVVLLCAALKWVSERWWHNGQRYVLPLMVGGAIFLDFHYVLCAFTPLLAIGVIVLGYKFYGKSDFWARWLWLMDAEIFLWIGCVVLNHLAWWLYLPMVGLCGVWGAISRGWNNNWVAPISGLLWGIIYFLVH